MDKENILKVWYNISVKYKIAIIFIIGIALLWYLLGSKLNKIHKARNEVISLRNKVQKKKVQLENLNKELKKIPILKRELKEIENNLEKTKGRLISGEEKTKLVNILTFKENEIDYSSFNIEVPEGKSSDDGRQLYGKYPIKINLNSNYLLLGEYLNYIENTDYVIRIKEVSIEKIKGSYSRIRTKINMVGYVAK